MSSSHLEELDFHLYQRLVMFRDPSVEWPKIADYEKRLFAHLEAFQKSGKKAVDAAIAELGNPESQLIAGPAYALVHGDSGAQSHITRRLQTTALDQLEPFEITFNAARSEQSAQLLRGLVEHDRPELRSLGMRSLSYRHCAEEKTILSMLTASDPELLLAAIHAAARQRMANTLPELERLLDHEEQQITYEAAFALCLLGSERGKAYLQYALGESADDTSEVGVYLACTGSTAEVERWLMALSSATESSCHATGIVGTPYCIEYLMAQLGSSNEAIRIFASHALERITGAGLRENYVHQEVWELPDGTTEHDDTPMTRISTLHDDWQNWLAKHDAQFQAGMRYRYGRSHSISELCAELQHPASLFDHRQTAKWEYEILTGRSLPFEVDWFVREQKQAIQAMNNAS